MYLQADMQLKEQALGQDRRSRRPGAPIQARRPLLAFLKSL